MEAVKSNKSARDVTHSKRMLYGVDLSRLGLEQRGKETPLVLPTPPAHEGVVWIALCTFLV